MSDETARILLQRYAEADAAEYTSREAFFEAVELAYQDKKQAEENLAYALGRFGVHRTIEILERQPQRIGTPRGAWYTADRFAAGGNERARQADDAIARLPRLAREFGAAEDRARLAEATYRRYCADHGIEPEIPDRFGPNSAGAAQVPAHLLWEPEGAAREAGPDPAPGRDWWDAPSASGVEPEPAAPSERAWWDEPEGREADPGEPEPARDDDRERRR